MECERGTYYNPSNDECAGDILDENNLPKLDCHYDDICRSCSVDINEYCLECSIDTSL